MYDFLVVGAGMAGASIAYELAKTARVCILERESQPGLHATGRSAALYAPSYGGREIRALTRASRPFFDQPPAGFSEHPLLAERGCLYIANASQTAELAKMAHHLGSEMCNLSVDAARQLVPLLRQEYLADALLDREAMDIDVDALHRGFLRGARALGAELRTNAHTGIVNRTNGIWNVIVDGATYAAPVIVNAAGAWADSVAVTCGAQPLGLQPRRRTAALIDPPAGVNIKRWPAVIDANEQFYFKPEAGKLLISPADETPLKACDAQADDFDVAIGIDRVQSALDIEVRRVTHSWAGLRTFAPDRVPVVGFDPLIEGFFWCAGQGGYGIQTAPTMGRVSAAMARRETLPADILATGVCAQDLAPERLFEGEAASKRKTP